MKARTICLLIAAFLVLSILSVPASASAGPLRLLTPKNGQKFTSKWYWDDEYEDYTGYAYLNFSVAGPRGLNDRYGDDFLYLELSLDPEVDEDGGFIDPIDLEGDEEYFMDSFRPMRLRGRYATKKYWLEPGKYYWNALITHNCDSPEEDECTYEFSSTGTFTVKRPHGRPPADEYDDYGW